MIPNPKVKFAKSKGVDLPIMYVYLAGYMSGEKLKQTMEWRKKIREHYRYWDGKEEAFPISFLDPYNGKEFKSIDKRGLTSSIPANAIYDGDRLSVNKADVIVANMNDFFLDCLKYYVPNPISDTKDVLISKLWGLIDKIKNYRPSIGTIFEICWAMEQRKPVILIVPSDKQEIYRKHPFTCRASQIVGSTSELLGEKVLETFYRRIAGAIYE